MKDSQHEKDDEMKFLSISKANNERFSTRSIPPRATRKYIKGE